MRLLMFDMDGTLINSGFAIANSINHVRINLGLTKLEKDYILENINDPRINASEFFYNTKEFTSEQRTLFEEYYQKNCLDNLHLYDGIEDLLKSLQNDYTLSIATNANSAYAKRMLDHLGIAKYFDTILGYNDVKNAKPHPEMVNKILKKHNILKSNAQMIGDSKKDTQAAFNAGIDSVLVNWGFSNYEKGAIETIKDLEEKISSKFNF
ncbi:MAG: HAD family hydrolase [Campylobacteraceae bacterium]|nr:HAD family hydrolase [Campylobacteraceae bacterium]